MNIERWDALTNFNTGETGFIITYRNCRRLISQRSRYPSSRDVVPWPALFFLPLHREARLKWPRSQFPVCTRNWSIKCRLLCVTERSGASIGDEEITWMTAPPFPPPEARNSFGKSNIFPSQSNIITSSSVQAGLANCEKFNWRKRWRWNLLLLLLLYWFNQLFLPKRIRCKQWHRWACQQRLLDTIGLLENMREISGCASEWSGTKLFLLLFSFLFFSFLY